ncbi:putative polysaccharide biosynthesis protein [Brevibacillus marinus]|uniref:putative polysaccharide biosynthesis protein n=1 Tax=Brevibacillus marinus TaxID=2496837 RepID=UPI000F844A00|nr:polysaccharide biosynthesis protein [Brevibacillus marinus]
MLTEKTSSHFVKGAAILGIAGLISKLLGAVYRIPYQNITGDIGLYVYMQVYPLYTTLLILATAGFPLAISKIVSERLALGDVLGARKTFRVASMVLAALGVLFFLLLYVGAPLISRIMGDEQLTLPLRAVAWSLPLVPVVAIMRGYFQGHQNMVPTGVSQVVEQLFRVIVIMISAYWIMSVYQDAYLAGTGAVFAAFPGALMALLVLLFYWQKNTRAQRKLLRRRQAQAAGGEQLSNRAILRSILFYALPICFGSLVMPLLPLVDSLTVANLLQLSGYSEEMSKVLKGVFDRGQPLIQFGTFFATSLSLALVPAISEAVAQGLQRVIAVRTELAIRLTLLLGLPATFGLLLLAEPINVMLYGDDSGTQALAIQAFTIVFATLSITSSGILQGLGRAMLPAVHLMIGVIVKLLANLLLIPFFGISGAAFATVLAYAMAMLLNAKAIVRHIGVRFPLRLLIAKPLLAVGIMAVVVLVVDYGMLALLSERIASPRLLHTVVAVSAVAAGAVVYGMALFWTGGLTRSDLRFIPKGERIASLLTRFGLLRGEAREETHEGGG